MRRDLLLDQTLRLLAYAWEAVRTAFNRSPNSELQMTRSLRDDRTVLLEATLAAMSDGIAIFDFNIRLVEWNARFPEIASVPIAMLRVGLLMDDITRAQAAAGVFGDVDIQVEVARRIADLGAGQYAEAFERPGPDGRVVELRHRRLPDGGFVIVYTHASSILKSVSGLREPSELALAEAAARGMSRFVAIASHEICTPLDALLNSLRLLPDGKTTATQRMRST